MGGLKGKVIMGNQRRIKPVTDNFDKQRTYRAQIGRYKRAMENEFFFEALLIDYALLEDRLRSMIYHMGFLTDRTAHRIWKKKSACLREIVSLYKDDRENLQLGITNISGKAKIISCVLKWAAYTDGGYKQDNHLTTLKSQCEGLDIAGFIRALDELNVWCAYRNEVIHGLMNKNLESLSEELKMHAETGMKLAAFFDSQVKVLKRGNKVRKSANLKVN